jgi:hypothetical protein
MLRFNRGTGRLWEDHCELLADPNIHAIIGKPRPRTKVRSQEPTPAAPTTTAPIEDPLTKFRRLVEELMLEGLDYTSAVKMVDEQHPDLRERSVELARYRSTVAKDHRMAKAAAWRVEVQRRFIARKAGR